MSAASPHPHPDAGAQPGSGAKVTSYVLLSRFPPPTIVDRTEGFVTRARGVSGRIRKECPRLRWRASWTTWAPFRAVDIVETTDPEEVWRAVLIIRSLGGHASAEPLRGSHWTKLVEWL